METNGIAPPKLAPVSGVLSQGQGVIKPIACRPVVSSAASTPILGHRPAQQQQQQVGQETNHGETSRQLGRNSWGLYNSTSDLCSSSKQTKTNLLASPQRFSWSKSQDQVSQQGCQMARKFDFRSSEMTSLPAAATATTTNANHGRVADLSRKFGGSLCSVAAPPNSPTAQRQPAPPPPAYRPPPARISGKTANGATYSSSELHLDRVARQPATSQWILGGSEVNLSNLTSVSLPRSEEHLTEDNLYSNPRSLACHYESIYSCSTRSSWAGLPSTTQSSNGSTLTLSPERRDDAATPIVEEGKIRSTVLSRQSGSGSLGSTGSLADFDRDNAADGTPSPSDSGVAELEALLKEKDCEIALLRETLEQNEAVIFQVYQEKEKSWERELKKLRSLFEERMRAAQQQASHAERQLLVQTQQWQAERKLLKQQLQQLRIQSEEVRTRLDDTAWSLCHKNGELALLKSQLKDAHGEQSQRCQEVAKLRNQVKESQEMLSSTRQRLEQVLNEQQQNARNLASPLSNRKFNQDDEILQLKNEMQRLQRRLLEQQQTFDTERQIWQEEKATVLMYQRHLQQQYIQAMKRNHQLEETLGLLGVTGVPPINTTTLKNQPLSSPKSNCSDPITIDLDLSSNSSHGESHC